MVSTLPTIENYVTPSIDESTIASYEILKQNIPFIQSETIAYLSSSWNGFDFNESSCSRDIGLIISGAAEDLLWGANSASIVNGKFYYEYPSAATGSQLNQTLDGINYASRLAQKLIQNIELQYPSSNSLLGRELLDRNRELIQNETIAYISSSWSTNEYNQETCKRDVGYILDAVKTDLVYGGNERTRQAGLFYYLYPSEATGVQIEETLDGIRWASNLSQKVLQNIQLVSPSQQSLDAYDLIFNNKEFIQEETIAYLSSSCSEHSYNESTCKRDVGFILDAVGTDVLYG